MTPGHRRIRRAGVLTVLLLGCSTALPAGSVAGASAASSPVVRYSATDVVVGTRVTATVDRDSRPAGTALVLQRQFPDAWRTADASASRTRRGFVLTVPSGQYGAFTYRVVAKDGNEVVSASTSRPVRIRPGYEPVGSSAQHAFADAPRVRWDSCKAVTWTFNPDSSPTGGLKQLKRGMKRVRQATGLELEYAGKTAQKPNPHGRDIRNGADIIIGWRTPRDFAPFRNNPGVLGLGGTTYQHGWQAGDGSPASRAYQGGVVLNARQNRHLGNGFGKGLTWGEVIIHEVGHVIGLAHPDGPARQIMHATVLPRNARWGAGDLAGLRKVGDKAGCLSPATARVSQGPATFSSF